MLYASRSRDSSRDLLTLYLGVDCNSRLLVSLRALVPYHLLTCSSLLAHVDIRDSTLDAADERALERLLESTARETQLRMMAESTAAPALSPLGLPAPAPQLLKYRTAPK